MLLRWRRWSLMNLPAAWHESGWPNTNGSSLGPPFSRVFVAKSRRRRQEQRRVPRAGRVAARSSRRIKRKGAYPCVSRHPSYGREERAVEPEKDRC